MADFSDQLSEKLNSPLMQLGINLLQSSQRRVGGNNFAGALGQALGATNEHIQRQKQQVGNNKTRDLQQQLLQARLKGLQNPQGVQPQNTLSPQEVAGLGLRAGTTVTRGQDGSLKVLQQPERTTPLVQVDTGDKIRNKGLEALETKAASAIETARAEANESVQQVRNSALLDQQLDQIEGSAFDTGSFSGFAQNVGKFALGLGLNPEDAQKIAASEGFEGLSNAVALLETKVLKGAISEKEIALVQKINTDLKKTPLGNRFAVARLRNTAQMRVLKADMIDQLREENPNMSLDTIMTKANRASRSMPYISATKKDARGLPIFYADFYQGWKQDNPSLTNSDIMDFWKKAHK